MQIKSAEFKKSIRGTDEILTEERTQVAFIGRSNVGKSSLMNCLLGEKELVKAGKTPGKTKGLNFFLINNDFYFVDLPGYGYAKMSLPEREQLARMIQWYFYQPAFKRKTILVLDGMVGPTQLDLEMLRILYDTNQEVIVVANKADRMNQKERSAQYRAITEEIPDAEVVFCSAKTGEGKTEIWEKLFGKDGKDGKAVKIAKK